eukprot:gene17430-biopygen4985
MASIVESIITESVKKYQGMRGVEVGGSDGGWGHFLSFGDGGRDGLRVSKFRQLMVRYLSFDLSPSRLA